MSEIHDLRAALRAMGVDDHEIASAESQGPEALRLFAIDRIILGAPKRYTPDEAAKLVGTDRETANRFWRALGFVDIGDDEVAFTESDVVALRAVLTLIAEGHIQSSSAVQVTRVMGQALSRVAEAQVTAMRGRIEEEFHDGGITRDDAVVAHVIEDIGTLLPLNEMFLGYMYRRHLTAAAQRAAALEADGAGTPSLAVGFCDLVGFTAAARRMEDAELDLLVERFEANAYDTIGALGGRLVKTIGDEVMFVAEDAPAAAEIGLRLSEAHTREKALPDVRVGLSYGPVLPREGDYFGSTVNLANRIAAVAIPRSVLASQSFVEALGGEESDYTLRRVPNRHLKGIGRTRLWAIRRGPG